MISILTLAFDEYHGLLSCWSFDGATFSFKVSLKLHLDFRVLICINTLQMQK